MEWLSDIKNAVFGDSPVLDGAVNAINTLKGSTPQQAASVEQVASQIASQNATQSNKKWILIGGGVAALIAILLFIKKR